MPGFRKERIEEEIRKVVSDKLVRERPLADKAFVTINKVDLSPDFRLARIFYSIFGKKVDEAEISILEPYINEFRHEISKKLNLRYTPKIEFCFDKNTEYAFKIERIFST